jgi:hypothetical protein
VIKDFLNTEIGKIPSFRIGFLIGVAFKFCNEKNRLKDIEINDIESLNKLLKILLYCKKLPNEILEHIKNTKIERFNKEEFMVGLNIGFESKLRIEK